MLCSSAISGGIPAVQKNSLNRQILGLAIPAIVANITTPLLSLVDVAIVGRLGSAAYLGAIAVGGTMFNLLYWLFGFLRTGTSGLTAQAEGRQSPAEATIVLLRSLALSAIFAITLIAVNRPLGQLLLHCIDPDADTTPMAWQYFSILIWGAPASLGMFALTGWFIGRQDTRATMRISLLVNIVNIVSSLTLVGLCGWKIDGVATGTLIAQWGGFIAAICYAVRRYKITLLCHISMIFKGAELQRFFSINTDIFLRTLCLIAVTLWFTRSGAEQGTVMLAVNTLLMQFFTLFSYFMDGFAFAAEALCGKACGANDKTLMRQTIRALMRYGATIATLFTALYFLGSEWFLNVITTDKDVIVTAGDYRLWAVAVPFSGFMAFTWDGILIGTTRTRLMLATIIAASAAFFILKYTLSPILANHALWIAFLSYLVIRSVTPGNFFWKESNKTDCKNVIQ